MYHVKVLKAADAEAAGRLAADQLQQAVCAKPACVLGLATGATPIPLYQELIRPRDRPVTNVVALIIVAFTTIPILLAYYLTRDGQDVAGSGK